MPPESEEEEDEVCSDALMTKRRWCTGRNSTPQMESDRINCARVNQSASALGVFYHRVRQSNLGLGGVVYIFLFVVTPVRVLSAGAWGSFRHTFSEMCLVCTTVLQRGSLPPTGHIWMVGILNVWSQLDSRCFLVYSVLCNILNWLRLNNSCFLIRSELFLFLIYKLGIATKFQIKGKDSDI